jgi:hypothetical protein
VNVFIFIHNQQTQVLYICIRIGLEEEYRFIEETDTHLSLVLTSLLQFHVIIFAKLPDMTWSFPYCHWNFVKFSEINCLRTNGSSILPVFAYYRWPCFLKCGDNTVITDVLLSHFLKHFLHTIPMFTLIFLWKVFCLTYLYMALYGKY